MISYPEWKKLLREIRLPAAIVDLDAFDRNLERFSAIARGNSKKLRLATKSLRVPALIQRALQQGDPFQGLMCYSAEEALFLATHQEPLPVGDPCGPLPSRWRNDLLIAYPTLRSQDLKALVALHAAGTRVALVVDSVEQLRALAAELEASGPRLEEAHPFSVVAEIDLALRALGGAIHLGARRSPLRSEQDLREFLSSAKTFAPAIEVIGCMGYESQVAGLGDRNPFKRWLNPLAQLVRRISVNAIARKRARVAAVFGETRTKLELFNGGGTGSLDFASKEGALTEVSAGSGLLSPHLFDYYSNIQFEPSCFFALQAVRSPDPGFFTCQGGGYIASGEPGWDRVPRPWLPAGAELLSAEGCGEVQTPLRIPREPRPEQRIELGDPILFRHAKAGELMERFNEVLLISRGKLLGSTKTYRGLGQSFF